MWSPPSNGGKVKVKLACWRCNNPGILVVLLGGGPHPNYTIHVHFQAPFWSKFWSFFGGCLSGRDGPPHYPPHGHPPPGGHQANQMDVGVLQTSGEISEKHWVWKPRVWKFHRGSFGTVADRNLQNSQIYMICFRIHVHVEVFPWSQFFLIFNFRFFTDPIHLQAIILHQLGPYHREYDDECGVTVTNGSI